MTPRVSDDLVNKVYAVIKKNGSIKHSTLRDYISGEIGGPWFFRGDREERACIEQLQRQGKPVVSNRTHVRFAKDIATRRVYADKMRMQAFRLMDRANKLENARDRNS